jgi:hypothetical protein
MKNCRNLPRPSIEALCPCGAKFYVFEKPAAVAHAEPACKAFADLEPDAYLAYVRKTNEQKRQDMKP